MSVQWDDTRIQERLTRAAMRGVIKAAELVRSEAISLILNTPKTGRIYPRRGIEHQASAPGEAPASDTGRLVNSIRTSYDVAKLTAYISADANYAGYLEFGTQKMEPRPFLRPALANVRDRVQQLVDTEIDIEMKR